MIREFNAMTGVETTREYNATELAAINDPAKLKENTNASIKAQIVALEAEITPRLQRDLVLRPNATVSRPNSAVKTPKKPVDFIADIDAQIEALVATLIP